MRHSCLLFFFNEPATTDIYTLSLTTLFRSETTGSGIYVFDSVQVGSYTVTVEKQGFKKFVSTGNQANINQPTTINVTLERSEEHTSELQSQSNLVCRLLLEKKNKK